MAHRKQIITFIVFLILLVACRAGSSPSATKTPAPPVRPTATMTPIPAAPIVEIEKSTSENNYDLKEADLPELMIPGEDGFRLDSHWQAAKIEYVYRAWIAVSEGGLSARAGIDDEVIEKKGSNYRWNGKQITTRQVNAFLSTLTNLHPVHSLLIGIFHSDDYPTWQLELTGTDGNHILIFSASDENRGNGPWHVIYNGRIYAQYDGTIGPAIAKLFAGTQDTFNWGANSTDDYHPANQVGFNTSGLPAQFTYGFTGLLPISDSFTYRANFAKNEIQGSIHDVRSIQSGENYQTIENLNTVELTVEDKKQACTITPADDNTTDYKTWSFSCKPDSMVVGQRYHYPIHLEFGTDTNKKIVTDGELRGIWYADTAHFVLPPAEEIQAAIAGNPDLQDLLKDHTFYDALYSGKMELGKDKSPVLLGNIVLQGQASVADTHFPYTITAPFGIVDRAFVDWGLTRQELENFISDVFKSPLTLRIYKNFPKTTLNLWYIPHDKLESFPAMPKFKDLVKAYFQIRLPACGKDPEVVLPQNGQPLRAFAFNAGVDFWNTTAFILVDGKAVPYEMNLYPAFDKDELLPYLTPIELQHGKKIPFLRIYYDYFDAKTHDLRLQPYSKTEDAANSIIASLPFASAEEFGDFVIKDTATIIKDDGSLSLAACSGK